MRKNLEELQEKMKTRLQVDTNVPLPATPVQDKPLCSHCHRRVCRAGTALCSRCTGACIQNELRDALPGMEVKKEVIPDRIVFTSEQQIQVESSKVVFPTSQQLQNVRYYTRKEVSQMVGVSPTSICRWEQKGKVLPPIKIVRTGQLLYTEEHVAKIKEYANQIEVSQYQPKPNTPENQQHDAAKFVAQKPFKLNRGLERAVATRLGRGGLGVGKLL